MFVHGGWLIQGRGAGAIATGLTEIRGRYHLQAPELKWVQISKRKDSAAIFRSIFDLLMINGGLPVFQVADKEYMTAAKVVETFLDPKYNRSVTPSIAGDYEVKKRLAERLMGAPVLLTFADCFLRGRRPDAADVHRVAEELAERFDQLRSPSIADTLRVFSAEAIEGIRQEFDVDAWNRTTGGHTLWAVLQNLEQLLRTQSLDVDIVHDNLVRFDDLFNEVGNMFGKPDLGPVRVVNGRVRFYSMPMISGLRLADSKAEPFIQLADLLCGFVRSLTEKLKDDVSISLEEADVLIDLAGVFQTFESWNGNLPDAVFAEFFRPWFASNGRRATARD